MVSLSEPHTSGTGVDVCVYACLQPLTINFAEQKCLKKIFLECVLLKQDVYNSGF